ncbi:hypothetical protein [Polaromonas sp. CG_9.11]|uniref:DUF748 domain-containing protein n=1 Tax=Polaromonas sp. CG_9.11 TaxID=2787730 RepID=UPI0018C97DB5|nr:hypothetical protein [Polaromonas sp. CG_9.11]MBG6075492.1 hypothetical protein [Polaromonas sp. CG_9.11]
MGIGLLVRAVACTVAPLIVTSRLERRGSEKLACHVSVGSVDFRPWSLDLTLHDLAVTEVDPDTLRPASPQAVPQLKIRRHYIDAELASLLRLAPVTDALRLEEPALSDLFRPGPPGHRRHPGAVQNG